MTIRSVATSRSRPAAATMPTSTTGGVSGEVVYDLGGAELTSITAYRYNKYIRGQDADFNNLDILFRDDDGGAFNRFKTFTQELRLQGNAFGDKLDWLVGGYYANEKLRVDDNLAYGDGLCALRQLPGRRQLRPAADRQSELLAPGASPTCFNRSPPRRRGLACNLLRPSHGGNDPRPIAASRPARRAFAGVRAAFGRAELQRGAPSATAAFPILHRALGGAPLPARR